MIVTISATENLLFFLLIRYGQPVMAYRDYSAKTLDSTFFTHIFCRLDIKKSPERQGLYCNPCLSGDHRINFIAHHLTKLKSIIAASQINRSEIP